MGNQNNQNIHTHAMFRAKPLIDQALKMNSRELVEFFPKICEHIALIQEIAGIRRDAQFKFSEEQIRDLKTLEELQSAVGELGARMDLIALQQYKSIPVEDFSSGSRAAVVSFRTHIRDTAARRNEFLVTGTETNGRKLDGPLGTLGETLKAYSDYYTESLRSRLEYSIAQKGGDTRKIYSLSGKRIDAKDLGDILGSGEPVFAVMPGQGIVPVFARVGGDPPEVSDNPAETVPEMSRFMSDRTDKLIRQIEDASPWWMATGSKEFSDMAQAMKHFAELAKESSYPPTPEQADALKAAIRDAKTKSENYLVYKAMQIGADNMYDDMGELQGRNARETARLKAARDLGKIIGQMDFAIDCAANPQTVMDKVDADIQRLDGQERIREEQRRQKELRRQQDRLEEERRNQLPEEDKCKISKEDLIRKKDAFAAPLQAEFAGDPLPALQKMVETSVESLGKLAAANKPITDAKEAVILQHMGRVVALRLIQMERAQWKQEHPGEAVKPGLMERTILKKDGEPIINTYGSHKDPKTGKTTNPFKELVGKVTPARIERFLMNGEDKKLAQDYLGKMAQKQEKNKSNPGEAEKKAPNKTGMEPKKPVPGGHG